MREGVEMVVVGYGLLMVAHRAINGEIRNADDDIRRYRYLLLLLRNRGVGMKKKKG